MASQIIYLDEKTINDAIENDLNPILIHFWADWCLPCQALVPTIENLSIELKDSVRFAKVNVDKCKEIATRFAISEIPTLILFRNGENLGQLIGTQTKENIKQLIHKSLSEAKNQEGK